MQAAFRQALSCQCKAAATFFCIQLQITRMKELESNSSWFARFSFDDEARLGVEQLELIHHWNTGLIFRYFCVVVVVYVEERLP